MNDLVTLQLQGVSCKNQQYQEVENYDNPSGTSTRRLLARFGYGQVFQWKV